MRISCAFSVFRIGNDLIGVAVVDRRVVEDPVLDEARGGRSGHAQRGGRDDGGRDGEYAARQSTVSVER